MSDKIFGLKSLHISEKDPSKIIFWGRKYTESPVQILVKIDGNDADVKLFTQTDHIYKNLLDVSEEKIDIAGEIQIPDSSLGKRAFRLIISANGSRLLSCKFNINRKTSGFVYNLEKVIYKDDESVEVAGWAIDMKPVEVRFFAGDGTEIAVERRYRRDLYTAWPELDESDLNAGFFIKIPKEKAGIYPWKLQFIYSKGVVERRFTRRTSFKEEWKAAGGIKRVIARSYEIAHEQGIRALISRLMFEIRSGRVKTLSYQKWIEGIEPDEKVLNKQREECRSASDILFSIVVPVYKPKEAYFMALIESVKAQTFCNWELILADAGKSGFFGLIKDDTRIKYISLEKNTGISGNTNEAIKKATGDWIIFADHDDTIAPDALYQMYKVIKGHPDAGYIYTDEDKISANGKKRFDPVFKPDINRDLLCSMNYISHLSAVKKKVLDQAGYLDPGYDGAQDYDLTLRCTELLRDDQIIHIPQVLYHWRSVANSTALDQENKLYAFDAGRRAIEAHLNRIGIPADVTELSRHGRYRIHYKWEKCPLVSVIIPNKDHIEDLSRCIDSILHRTEYPNYEIIVVENNSTEQNIFDYYKTIETNERIRIVKYEGGFNFSAINNFGVSYAKGDFYLLLNNDTEVINPEWMTEMVYICIREDVGIVGAKLYYPDGTIQHAGVVIGIGGVAGHAFKYYPHSHPGTADRLLVCQDYSAVTAACMLVKKEAFEKAGGLSENLAVAFNDVDFCLKVGQQGYRVVFTPYAELTHYESISRGSEDTAEKQERFRNEIETFLDKWGDFVRKGDPYYNKHFSLKREDFSYNEELTHE